jgi:hypothetical protein
MDTPTEPPRDAMFKVEHEYDARPPYALLRIVQHASWYDENGELRVWRVEQEVGEMNERE